MFRSPELRRLWDEWAAAPDAAEACSRWEGICQQATETMIVSGEVFTTLEISETVPGVPLSLQLVGQEFLDTSKSDWPPKTISGIEFSGVRRSGYWLHSSHPATPGTTLDSVRVDAADCLHLFKPLRPGLQRGESWFTSVLYLIRLLRGSFSKPIWCGKKHRHC